MDDFVALILSNNRPENVKTYETLKRFGYTGPIRIVIDNLDPKIEEYKKIFSEEEIIVFDKESMLDEVDTGDNFNDLRAVVYARNAAFDVARDAGFKTFIVLDDDYHTFRWRFDSSYNYNYKKIYDLDRIFKIMREFVVTTPVKTLTMAQGGDFIGGEKNLRWADKVLMRRKAMNSFVCHVDKPFEFMGRINEDVNAYTSLAPRGDIFFTTNFLSLEQGRTQANEGGLTEAYLKYGTYVKSFYSILYQPSSVFVSVLRSGVTARLHHRVDWDRTTPMIVSEDIRKKSSEGKHELQAAL